jgi:ubiquinone biosynthesis protein
MPTFGLFARALMIQVVAWLSLLRYAAARLRLALTREPGSEASWAEIDALRGRVLRRAMETLGATFLKLGQVMSTRRDLFPPEMIAELRLLQDRIPGFPGARAVIERELGRPIEEVFRELDEEPLAAASVAQVHRGVLLDAVGGAGTEVAVKVLRPDVRALAERDGRILIAFARVLEALHPRAAHAQLALHTGHFVEGIVAQTDLRVEARNYETFRHNFRRNRYVRFPKVYPELSGERVMTMELVRGVKVDAVPRSEIHPEVPARLREAFLQMCLVDGFLHVDLHPGNFVVDERGVITIFDVGLVKQLSDELLGHYVDFNRVLVMGTTEDTMRHLRRYHSYVDGTVDWVELERDMERFQRQFRASSARDLEFGLIIDEVFAIGRKHGVRPVPEMTLMMVGLITAEGIGKQLDPDVNSFQEVANYLIPVLARREMLTPELMSAAAELSARALEAEREPPPPPERAVRPSAAPRENDDARMA